MAKQISRRACLKKILTTVPACGLAGSLTARNKPATPPKTTARSLRTGIATLGFREYTNAELARELSDAGFKTIQLILLQKDSNFWKFNGRNDLSELTPARSREIAATYREAGLDIHSIGVYTNLMHPDPAEIDANLAYFDNMMAAGSHMGVNAFVTESGRYVDTTKPTSKIHFYQDEVWVSMVANMRRLTRMAEKYDATIMVEPSYATFFSSAKRVRVFIEEVASPRLRVLLDPANLFELNDLDEMFNQLKPWIDCVHAKDIKHHIGRGVPAGQGDIDYKQMVELTLKHTPRAPVILEYVGAKTYRAAYAHLLCAMKACGIQEA